MRRTRRRGAPLLIALAILLALASAPADALTVQRSWSARIGSSGANGTVSLKAYTSGTGTVKYSLKGMRASATYTASIRYGTCAKLGSVAVRFQSVKTSSTGTLSLTRSLTSFVTYYVWKAGRTPSFVIRFVSGTSIKCGAFSFAKATRVAVSGLGIDLPVIRGTSSYPPCRVALYLPRVSQPREPGITFLYAHARTGMFLPLLTRWKADRGASLIGRTVIVWTSDSYANYYKINKVRVTSDAMAGVTSLTRERVWLQTSTGPNTSYPKLIVEAYRYKTVKSTYGAAHPTARPISC